MTNPVSSINLRTMVRESAISYFGTFGLLGVGFATKALLARALTPSEYGLLIVAQTIAGIGLTLMQSGVPDTVVRFVGLSVGANPGKAKGVVVSALKWSLVLIVPVAFGLGSGASSIARHIYKQPLLAGVLILSAAAMPFTTITEVLAAAYRGINRLWVKVVLSDIGRALLVVAGVGLLVALHACSLERVTAIYTAAAMAIAAVTITMFVRGKPWRAARAPAPVGEMVRYSLPLMGSSLVVWPMTAIPLLLGRAVSAQAVAYYTLATAIANLVFMPTSAVEMAALPSWAGYIAQNDIGALRRGYVFATRWCLIAAFAIFGPLALCSADILGLIYGPNYREAAFVVQTIAVIFLINAATGPTPSLLRAFGYTRWIFWGQLAGGAGALAAAALLIPVWGMSGALAALGISNMLMVGVQLFSLYLVRGIHPFDGSYAKIIVSGFLALLGALFMQRYMGQSVWRIGFTTLLHTILFASLLFALCGSTLLNARLLHRIFGDRK